MHAETVVSIQRTSTTLSGGHSPPAVAGVWALSEAGRTANRENTNEARDIAKDLSRRGKRQSYPVVEASSKVGVGAAAWRVLVRMTT